MEVARYLLDRCDASTELVGSVVFDGDTIEGAPPLWCASAAGHSAIVKLLVERGANVNAVTCTHSSPLRAACFDGHFSIVKYLVDRGADIEIANRHGHTCLMISCFKGHLSIARLLVAAGALVNRRSVKGNTALHDCAESGRLDMLQFLIQSGARIEPDAAGTTPLLAAAMCGHTAVVEYLLKRPDLVTRPQMVDALELLAATCVDKKSDLTAATTYWKRALDKRYEDSSEPLLKPAQSERCPHYDNTCEARSHEDLDQLTSDPDQMRMQALIVRERILGPAHPETSYYIRYRGAVYADTGNFNRCIQLWMYALGMQQSQLEPLSPLTQSSLMSFAELFSFMIADERNTDRQDQQAVLSYQHVVEVFSRSVDEVVRGCMAESLSPTPCSDPRHRSVGRSLSICMHLLCILTRVQPPRAGSLVHRLLYRLQKCQPVTRAGFTPLHVACSQGGVSASGRVFGTGSSRARTPLLSSAPPSVAAVRLLLETGGDVDARDHAGNTPLHVLAAGLEVRREQEEEVAACLDIAQCLIEAGAHVDMVNSAGLTAQHLFRSVAKSSATKCQTSAKLLAKGVVQLQSNVTLQCMAARVISQMPRQYIEQEVPPHLLAFVNTH